MAKKKIEKASMCISCYMAYCREDIGKKAVGRGEKAREIAMSYHHFNKAVSCIRRGLFSSDGGPQFARLKTQLFGTKAKNYSVFMYLGV